MKYNYIFLLFCCFFLTGHSVFAETEPSLSKLDSLSDEALQLTRFEKYDEAKSLLNRYADLFSEQAVSDRSFSMDELRVITSAHHEAVKALSSADMINIERVNRVAALRLATDAVVSKYQPLWAEMEGPIMTSFQQVKNAALEGDGNSYNRQLNDFLSTYTIIQPSLKIDIPIEKLQILDSKIIYIDKYRTEFSEPAWSKELDLIEADLKNLFSEIKEDELDPSVWWVMIMTGSIIVLTLSYVSWRKYRGQKKHSKDQNSND